MQTNSKTTPKTDSNPLNSQRIPVVPRPYIHYLNQSTSPQSTPPSSLVIPLPHEISQLPSSGSQESEQNVSIRVENPFECLASFYFPEHLDMTGGCGYTNVDYNTKDNNNLALGNILENPEVQEAEEEFNINIENSSVTNKYNDSEQFKVIYNDENVVLNDVPELVKILQTKAQKKIFLEVRS